MNQYARKKVGFTGTRDGLTYEQKRSLRRLLVDLEPTSFSFGDCIGADHQAANIVAELDNCLMVRHPPNSPRERAFCDNFDEDRPKKQYHARNRDIVDENDLLVACPKGFEPVAGSGSWWTIEYARSRGKPVFIVYSDGKVEKPKEVGV